jgi:hypothetical protein
VIALSARDELDSSWISHDVPPRRKYILVDIWISIYYILVAIIATGFQPEKEGFPAHATNPWLREPTYRSADRPL